MEDAHIYLDVDSKVARKRILERRDAHQKAIPLDYLESLSRRMKRAFSTDTSISIDASGTPDERSYVNTKRMTRRTRRADGHSRTGD